MQNISHLHCFQRPFHFLLYAANCQSVCTIFVQAGFSGSPYSSFRALYKLLRFLGIMVGLNQVVRYLSTFERVGNRKELDSISMRAASNDV